MINVSSNFWNLSTVTWGMSHLPYYYSNLSTNYRIDNSKLTTAVNNITSVSIVANNAWDYCVNGFGYINNLSLSNLSTTAWNTSSQLSNVSSLLGTTNASLYNSSNLLGTILVYWIRQIY